MELKIGEFVFNSQSSLNYGIYVDDVIPFIPPKRLRRQTIAGKSGTFDYGSKDYDDIGVTLKCYSKKEYERAEWREVVYWLSKKARLYIWDDPDKYYIGELQDADDLDWRNLSHMEPFKLNFICEPFAYKDIPAKSVQSGNNSIEYQGTFPAPVVIRIQNVGNVNVSNITITTVEKEGSL